MGFSKDMAASLISSGYAASAYSPTIIDRFHGGPLISTDARTRFSEKQFRMALDERECMNTHFPLFHAKSGQDVRDTIEKIQTLAPSRPLCYRGQTSHHSLDRKIKNPNFNHPDLGETSLVPSVWRLMLNSSPHVFPEFVGLNPNEWSTILYKMWPMEEIRSREKALQEKGEWLSTISEMEDCSDELLRAFGRFRGEFHFEEVIFQIGLLTMMQHYGLPTPFLDLTTDLEVAIFFATHKFGRLGDRSTYEFVGTNNRQSIIYALSIREGDMHTNERNRIMKVAKPERPYRQSCIVASTNAWSINLPADYIVGAIFLDFDMDEAGQYVCDDLFPKPDEDAFLKAWASTGDYPLTLFHP